MLPSMPELNPIRLPCVLLHGQAVGHGKVFAITARFRLTISLISWVLSESRTTIASGVVGNLHNQPLVK